jgi:hypothetical protein
MGHQFPSNSWLHKCKLRTTPYCELCPCTNATTGHIQCDCPKLADARTQVHNTIWTALWEGLSKTAGKHGWETAKEATIKETDFKHRKPMELRRPDGIMIRQTEARTDVLLLDLTRCRGYNRKSFHDAITRKEEGYRELMEDLKKANPGHRFRMIPLPVGSTGNIAELQWKELCHAIGMEDKEQKKLLGKATEEACKAFTYMVDIWRTAQQHQQEEAGGAGGLRVVQT